MVSTLVRTSSQDEPLFGLFWEHLYVGVSQDMRVKWYDTMSSLLRGDFTAEHHLSERYTCLAVGRVLSTGKMEQQEMVGSKSGANFKVMIALGHEQGHVSLYSMTKGVLDFQLRNAHQSRINAFVFGKDGLSGYSASDDPFIVVWDLRTKLPLTQWTTHQGSVKSLLLSKDNRKLYSGGRTIRVWDIETRSMLLEFSGHANPLKSLVMDDQERWLISLAENDRFLNVWDLKAAQPRMSSRSLALDSEPVSVIISQLRDDRTCVASLAEDGLVYIWKNIVGTPAKTSLEEESLKHSKKKNPLKKSGTQRYDTSIRYVSDVDHQTSIPIFDLEFPVEHETKLTIHLARGGFLQPQFEQVPLQVDDKDLLMTTEMILSRSPSSLSGFSVHESKAARKLRLSKKVYDEGKATIMTGVLPMTNSLIAETNSYSDKKNETFERDQHQPSIAEKLKELETEEKAVELQHAVAQLKGMVVPKANSLQKMLIQALHSNDNQLLEQCLAVKDPIIIQNTVKKLPTAYVLPFLNQVVQKFQLRPNRGMVLTSWIKAVLTLHTAYLMSVPNLVKNLTGLYQTIDSRLTVFNRLLRLSGQLDLLMSQVTLRNHPSQGDEDDSDSEAINVYREGEEDYESSVSDEDLMANLMDDTMIGDDDDVDEEDDLEDYETDEEEEEKGNPSSSNDENEATSEDSNGDFFDEDMAKHGSDSGSD